MAKVIIFGIRDLAELAHFYLTNDSEHEVVAFSVNKEYLPEVLFFKGLPIIPFENVDKKFSPKDYSFFAPMTHTNMNKDRESIYQKIKKKRYNLISYVSSLAIVFDKSKIGENCFILENVVIQPFTNIGNNNIIWSNSIISHHSRILDNIFIAPSVAISGNCLIKSNSFIGIGAIIRDGITIERGNFIAMGSQVIEDTKINAFYRGSPAKFIKNIFII